MSDENTGLGDSLLLKRTSDDNADKSSDDVQTPETSKRPDAPTDRQGKPPRRGPRDLRDRCTIYLDPEINRQLDLVARIERKQRSEVVADILRANLPKYRIDLE